MKNTKRKGFTIVELVIVIAVIAILAAVLIPTFASLVKKANVSADEQAVKQMNTALAIYTAENGKPETIGEVKTALDKNLINAEGLVPVTQGYAFFWDGVNNKIVLVGDGKETAKEGWVLLTSTGYGKAPADSVTNAATLKDAIEESSSTMPVLVKLDDDLDIKQGNETAANNEIKISQGKSLIIDLNGYTLTTNNRFTVENGGTLTVKNGSVNSSERAFKNVAGTLSLNGVKIDVTGDPLKNGAAIFLSGISDTSIVNCEITTSKGHGIATNSSKAESDGVRISIIDSKIKSTDVGTAGGYAGINIGVLGNVTIDGCEVTGVLTGAYLRGCNAKITNSKFSHTGTQDAQWGTGNSGPAADLVLACGGTSNYTSYIATVNYTCENVTASKVIVHNPNNEGTINVSGIEGYHFCRGGCNANCSGDTTCGN